MSECPACAKDVCPCTQEERLAAEIQADIDWAFGQVAEARARMRPRDSMPLVAYQSGWDK